MTGLWSSIDANQQAVAACVLTMLLGLFIGAASVTLRMRRAEHPTPDDVILAVNEAGRADFEDHFAAWEQEVSA